MFLKGSDNIKSNLFSANINNSHKVDRNYYNVIIIKTVVKFDLQQNPIGSEDILRAIILWGNKIAERK